MFFFCFLAFVLSPLPLSFFFFLFFLVYVYQKLAERQMHRFSLLAEAQFHLFIYFFPSLLRRIEAVGSHHIYSPRAEEEERDQKKKEKNGGDTVLLRFDQLRGLSFTFTSA